jgi:hypothetical protein
MYIDAANRLGLDYYQGPCQARWLEVLERVQKDIVVRPFKAARLCESETRGSRKPVTHSHSRKTLGDGVSAVFTEK